MDNRIPASMLPHNTLGRFTWQSALHERIEH